MLKLERRVLKKVSGTGLHSPLNLKPTLCDMFHENTKLTPLSGRAYSQTIAAVLRSPAAKRLMDSPYKLYNLMDQVDLDLVSPQSELENTIAARRSTRRFSGEPITREELSRLLFFSYGRTDPRGQFRAVSSGGALYPLELYVVARNVTGLASGIYHYDVEHHRLDVVRRGDGWEDLKRCVWVSDVKDPETIAALVFVTAIFQRSTFKYLDRGYRLILMEAGEVGQNMALLATSMGLGACLLGGFLDNMLSEQLGIDGIDEAPLLPIVLGRKPAGKPRETAEGADEGGQHH